MPDFDPYHPPHELRFGLLSLPEYSITKQVLVVDPSAVVLDVSDLPAGHLAIPTENGERPEGIGHSLSFGEIVLFRTGADAFWGTEEYFSYGYGLGRETLLYLAERGVRVMGTDAWSLDRPYPLIGAEW